MMVKTEAETIIIKTETTQPETVKFLPICPIYIKIIRTSVGIHTYIVMGLCV